MARQNAQILAFNRGLVGSSALARVDIDKLLFAAEQSDNWLPRTLGPMTLRPGLGYTGQTEGSAYAVTIPFVFATDDTALLELTAGAMRVWVNDALVTRPTVSTAIANGTFNTDIASWTSYDETGATSAWATGGFMSLQGNGFSGAIREQLVTVAPADIGVEHAVRVSISTGECHLLVGSTSGGSDYVTETFLFTGEHSISFTPTGDFYVRILSREPYPSLIDSVTIDTPGVLSLPTPWVTSTNLKDVRYDQSGDVIFAACFGVRPMRIERRSTTSWSVTDFITDDGPFLAANVTTTTLTAAATRGATTLTASAPLFEPGHVGALFKHTSVGTNISFTSGAGQWCDEVKVTGSGTSRDVAITVNITGTATVQLQRAVGDTGDWFNVKSYTATTTETYNDALSGQVVFYRLFTESITSGTVSMTMDYQFGSKIGLMRVTGYTSPTQVSVNVLRSVGSTKPTDLWSEGRWSAVQGYPSVVTLAQGRLFLAGNDHIDGSVSDSYISFDEDYVGDAGPIARTLGTGPVEKIRWLHSGARMLIGGQSTEWEARSSSLDEPFTPLNFNIKPLSTRGSAALDAVMVDHDVLFLDRSQRRVVAVAQTQQGAIDLADMNLLAPDLLSAGVVCAAVQRQPDTRLHCVLADGSVAILVYDRVENVRGWTRFVTDGVVEWCTVLPTDTGDDVVYYVVQRTIGGSPVRYLERLAAVGDCIGGTLNKQADSFIVYQGAATDTITGLDHLEGESVVCWADGVDKGTFTVASGSITLPSAVSNAVVGLPYTARWKSTKLAFAAQGGSALTQPKRIDHLGLILANTHAQGLRHGVSFDALDDMPLYEKGAEVDPDYVWPQYDNMSTGVNGTIDTDPRLCLEAAAPRPATVLGAVISITTHERI